MKRDSVNTLNVQRASTALAAQTALSAVQSGPMTPSVSLRVLPNAPSAFQASSVRREGPPLPLATAILGFSVRVALLALIQSISHGETIALLVATALQVRLFSGIVQPATSIHRRRASPLKIASHAHQDTIVWEMLFRLLQACVLEATSALKELPTLSVIRLLLDTMPLKGLRLRFHVHPPHMAPRVDLVNA